MQKLDKQPNAVQKAIAWVLQKAIGFPAWNVSQPMPSAYRNFFRETNPIDAMQQVATVYICCNLIGRRVATFPIDVVQSDGNVSVPVESYIADLLAQPNEYMDQVAFFETLCLSLNLRGNSYNEIVRIGNRVTALWPIHPDRVVADFDGRNLVYKIAQYDGTQVVKQPRDIWHIRNFSFDGIHGLTPLCLYAVRKAMAAGEMYDSLVRNGIRPSVKVKSPLNPTKEEKERAQKLFEEMYAGPSKTGRAVFAWGGGDIEALSLSPADAELLKAMQMDEAAIGAAYGVPLMMLNREGTPTYASAEQDNRRLVDYTFDPLCTRIALSATRNLLNPRLGQKIKFNLDALLAGDSIGRANYLRTLVAAGLMTPNEGRAKLNLPPKPGGDDLITQSNQAPLDQLGELAAAPKVPQLPPAKSHEWHALTEAVADVGWKASMQ